MRYRPKRHQYVALVLLALAGVVYSTHPAAVDIRPWKPLDVPIQLKVGRVHTAEFEAGLGTNYRLLVESERRIEFKRLECLLGMVDWQRAQTCADAPEMIDIDWSVLHDGQVAATGSSRNSSGGFYSRTVAREIGRFAARKGQHYAVVLDIRRDGGELSTTDPKLLVQTDPGEWKDAVVGFALTSMLRTIGIAIFAIAGLLTLILTPLFGWLYRLYQRRKRAPVEGLN